MSYTAVQFLGRSAVLKAFENTDFSNWSMLQGKQFLFKYEGHSTADARAELAAILSAIEDTAGSEATYTLRVYDFGDTEPKKGRDGRIKPTELPKRKIYYHTDFDGSFNFKLFERGENPREISYRENAGLKAEVQELKTMMQAILKQQQADNEEEKETGIAGVLNGLLEHPQIKEAIAGKVVQLFNGVTNKLGSYLGGPNMPAKIAGPVPAGEDIQGAATAEMHTAHPQPIQLPKESVDKLNAALTVLVSQDKNFADHLYKLSQIAQNNPSTYTSLIGMLEKM